MGQSKFAKPLLFGLAICLSILTFAIFVLPSPLPQDWPANDFRAYWSATRLLVQRGNFADASLLYQVEREQTAWREDYPMITWNPPWLLVILIPMALVPFANAVWYWLLLSIIMVFVSMVLLWQFVESIEWSTRGWVVLLLAFTFAPTLVAFLAGQINVLVLVGLTGFLWFSARKHYATAGMLLSLATVKPQLVYLTVPIALLSCIQMRHYRVILGFIGTLIGLTIVVFALRPTFVFDYTATVSEGNLFAWETPTLGGLLDLVFGWRWAKLMGVLILPLTVMLWWALGRTRNIGSLSGRTLVDVTLICSVITAPFAWSYDFIVLLVPLVRVISCIVGGKLHRVESAMLVLGLIAMELAIFYQRVLAPSEVFYAWVPWVVAVMYVYSCWRYTTRSDIYRVQAP